MANTNIFLTNITRPYFLFILLVSTSILLTACGGAQAPTTTNHTPVANAVSNSGSTVSMGSTVMLNGSGSSDADKDPLSYRWAFNTTPAGSALKNITNSTSVQASFTPDMIGNYVVQLITNDGKVDSMPATITITVTVANHPPVANAGANQTVTTGMGVTLNGTGSSDPDGNAITYAWTLTSKPATSAVSLSNATTANPMLTPDVAGNYVIQLIVRDGIASSNPATVTITATAGVNRAPVANAGMNQSVNVGTQVTLNGSGSSDPDGNTITYVWLLTSKPAGSAATLVNPATVSPKFTPDIVGSYTAQLIVNDGMLNSVAATMLVTATQGNRAPVANAGTVQAVTTGTLVTLNGSGSSDPDGNPITYSWTLPTRPAGSAATLANATTARPTFTPDVTGSYVARLIVNDGTLSSAAATVTITASTANRAPVANAGTTQTVTVNTLVTLNGSGSSDPDGNAITYAWTLMTRPSGSAATLSAATTARPTFTPDIVGTYVAQLIVSDGALNSTATVSITANPANRPPMANAGPDASSTTNLLVTLNGTASSDPDGNAITYAWTLPTRPAGSAATLASATTARPTFTPDVAGTYVAQLVVNDGQVNSAADTVNIVVSAPPPPPPVSCDSLKSEFQSVTWGQVLRPSCVNCHAGVSSFTLVPESTAGFNDINFNNFKVEAAKNGNGNIPLILTKATNLDNHSGGVIMTQGSANYMSLSDMIAKTKTCTTGTATSGVIYGSGYNRLRKTTLALAARLPTSSEEATVNSAGADDAAITTAINLLLDPIMTEPAFYTRVKEIYNDMLLTDYYAVGITGLNNLDLYNFNNRSYFDSGNLINAGYSSQDATTLSQYANIGLARAPLELVANVVRNDQPLTEILTANYVMVNSYSAAIYDATVSGSPGFTFTYGDALSAHDPTVFMPVQLTDKNNRTYEHTGILSTLPFLSRYPSTATNRNRGRTRYTFLYFLDTDIQGLADRSGLDFTKVTGQFPTLTDPQCSVCHNVMDPVAGLYKNWSNTGAFSGNVTNWFNTRNPKEMLEPGYTLNTADLLPANQSATALQFLGRRIAADDRFATATVKTVLRGLMGPDATQDAILVDQLKTRFITNNYKFKDLIKGVVASNQFKVVNLGTNENPVNYATLGTPILSTPEQLDRKVTAITGGYQWRSPSNNTLVGNTFRLLYGGIDSMDVTVRTQEPTSAMASIQERIANQAACSAVPSDLAKATASRVMFPNVAVTDIPDNGTGTDRIKQNIVYLHKRILGEELSASDPEIARTYDLFVAVRNSTTGTIVSTDCGGSADANRTIRSWMAVVSYLMMDYKFLFE